MNHPSSEQWIAYLYEELDPTETEELRRHLMACTQCLGEVSRLQACQRQLNEWELPPEPSVIVRRNYAPALWGFAAAALIVVAFIVGRFQAPASLDPQQMSATIRGEIQQQLRATEPTPGVPASSLATTEAVQTAAARLEKQLAQQNQQLQAAILQLQRVSQQEIAHLRQELETVALVGEGRHQGIQNQFTALGIEPSPFPPQFTLQTLDR